MRERPLLMSGPLLGPTMRGEKTNTRRVAPIRWDTSRFWGQYDCWTYYQNKRPFIGFSTSNRGQEVLIPRCPYGTKGDRLWVKEEHWQWGRWWPDREGRLTKGGRQKLNFEPVENPILVGGGLSFERPKSMLARRDGQTGWVYRHARFMPRALSRITLEVTSVRLERVQDISKEDAKAEGINPAVPLAAARAEFARLWGQINGARPGCSWEDNPWVWAVEFKRINQTEGTK